MMFVLKVFSYVITTLVTLDVENAQTPHADVTLIDMAKNLKRNSRLRV